MDHTTQKRVKEAKRKARPGKICSHLCSLFLPMPVTVYVLTAPVSEPCGMHSNSRRSVTPANVSNRSNATRLLFISTIWSTLTTLKLSLWNYSKWKLWNLVVSCFQIVMLIIDDARNVFKLNMSNIASSKLTESCHNNVTCN